MKTNLLNYNSFLLIICLSITGIQSTSAQYVTPAILDTATVESQLDYIQERTRIYNDFRAIRDDIFLKMKANVLDSLNAASTAPFQNTRPATAANKAVALPSRDSESSRDCSSI